MPNFPAGIQLTTILFGKGVSPTGDSKDASLTVEVVFGSTAATAIVWAADGTPLYRLADSFKSPAGEIGSAQVPVVDQDGWIDGKGDAYKMWGYRLTERVAGLTRVKYWQPLMGQVEVDFDMIPDGTLGLPVTAPAAVVTSVNGQTGAVEITEPDVSGLLSVEEKGASEGVAPLDQDRKLFTENLPEYLGTGKVAPLVSGRVPDTNLPTRLAADKVAPLEDGKLPEANVPDRLTEPALSATFVPVALGRPGNRLVTLGDSITQAQFDYVNRSWGSAWPLYAQMYSQGRLHLVANAGIAGNKISQMLARFDTDVAPHQPNIVVLLAGTNDIGATPTQTPFASWKADVQAIVARIRNIGAAPVLVTIPPRDAGSFNADIVLWNAWLRDYAARSGISVLDFYRALTDPANGHFIPAYTSDGIHPSTAGDAILGELAAWVLSEMVPVGSPMLPVDSTDPNNLVGSAGMFLTAAGNGVGTGWAPGSAPSGVTKSVVTDPGIKGRFQRIAMAGASGLWAQSISLAGGWAVGDKLRFVGVLDSDGGAQASGRITFTGGGGARPFSGLAAAISRGVWCQTVTIPAGTTAISIQLECGGAGATGVVQFGQVGVYDLTKMGIEA